MSSSSDSRQLPSTSFLSGGGEMGRLMRDHEWSGSPLGSPDSWPQSLRSVVGLLLNSKFPMFVAWGSELGFLYNDPYSEILGAKHPKALGARFHDIWAEIWPDIEPLIDAALAGEATYREDLPLLMRRTEFDELTWFTFSYSPVLDEEGEVAGMFCACTETTEQVVGRRRRDALLKLDERISRVSDTADLSFAASELLGETLGAVRVGYGLLDREARTISVERNWSAPGYADVAGLHRFSDYGSYIDELLRGEIVANDDVKADPRTAARQASFDALGIAAHMDVPVVEDGRAVAEMFVHSPVPRQWTDGEKAFVKDFAERTHAAIARRAAEQELRESEARFRLMADAVPQIVWITDAQGRLEFFNKQWSDYTGALYRQETAAEVAANYVHPDDSKQTVEAFAAALRTGATFIVEHRVRSQTGEYRWFLVRGEPYRDPRTGQIVSWFGASVDIHDRKIAEARLRELNENLADQAAQRSAERDRLWTLSQDMLARADYSGMMSAVSPAWTWVLGWEEHELLSRGYATFMHPNDMPPTLDAIARMSKTGEPTRFENRIATRDGGWKSIEWTVAPEPDRVNFIAIGRDLSHGKARESELEIAREALRQSQKMEAMGSLTGGVAHDFNNLLTPIIGALDMLVRKGLGSERERRLIDGALQSGERAKTLVQRLLAFARRQPLQAVPVDLKSLVEGMVELIDSTLGPTIDVRVNIAADLPPAKADPNQLEMALLNLAVNARDAMPNGGELAIRADRQTVKSDKAFDLSPGEYVRLSVSDTGAGMDEETRRRAIEPFFSTKGVGRGTGLGLSMVHGLAAQLGGGLAIDSAPSKGTTVQLWLPICPQTVGTLEKSAAVQASRAGRGTALLVDDEDLVRMSTANMLIDMGFEVMEAGSAEEALDLLRSGASPDILITDHLMPGMNGAELARAADQIRSNLPVLIVSGYAEAEAIAPELPRLSKPFRNAELSASLASLMPSGSFDP